MLKDESSVCDDYATQSDDDVKDVAKMSDHEDDDIVDIVDFDQDYVSFPENGYSNKSGRKWPSV